MKRTGALAAVISSLLLLWYAMSRRQADAGAPATSNGRKVLVMAARGSDDTSWAGAHLPDWHQVVYDISGSAHSHPSMHRVPKVKGGSAMAYLTYIIDHYDDLPAFTAFVHANRTLWLSNAPGNDNVGTLQSLRLNYVQHHGYANLRCTWDPGCPDEVQPYSRIYGSARVWEAAMPAAWKRMFGEHFELPRTIAAAAGSQFVVARWQILRRPRYEYAKFREWLTETLLSDHDSGRAFEFLWHVIFERTAIHCPDEYRCACDQFGRC